MVPPDGVRSKRLPTMSWESVVEDGATSVDADPPVADVPHDAHAPLASEAAITPLTQPAPISFSSAFAPSADPLPMQSETTIEPISFAPLTLDPTPAPGRRTTGRAVRPHESDRHGDHRPRAAGLSWIPCHRVSPILRRILWPEPVHLLPTSLTHPPHRQPTSHRPSCRESSKQLRSPKQPPSTVSTSAPPSRRSPRDLSSPAANSPLGHPQPQLAYEFAEHAPVASAHLRHQSPRRGLKLLLTLVILGGLTAAGIVFGRPYLFPDGWDEATRPYAEAVETARGVEFIEPIAVIAEPTVDYTTRLGGELVGDWSADEPVLRALGLLNGPTTEESVTELLADWQDAVYSTVDGQVYTDTGVTGAQLDAEITEEMTAASLDQEFRWSAEQSSRTLDDQVLTLAEVQRQASAVLAKTPFATTLEPLSPGVLAYVPPIVGYGALAPATFAEFENPATGAENPLATIGTAGPGPLVSEVPVAAVEPTLIGADVLVGSPRSLDRSFWFLVFAGFLDSRSAYQASESVVENSLATADRAGTQCVYATFSGGDVVQTATLRAALEGWLAAAPIEFASSFSVLADGTLQLVSCDPGVGFENPNRLGVARELVGWRTAELATLEAVRTASGTEADAAAAWAAVEASNVGVDLGALPGRHAARRVCSRRASGCCRGAHARRLISRGSSGTAAGSRDPRP